MRARTRDKRDGKAGAITIMVAVTCMMLILLFDVGRRE